MCYQYWPSSGDQQYGEYSVDLLGEEELEGHIIRTLNITHATVEYNQLLHASVEDHSMKTIDFVELGFNNVKFSVYLTQQHQFVEYW